MRKVSLLTFPFCWILAAPALADVSYEQETKLGGLMKIATLGRNIITVTRIAGDKMRTESGKQVQIVDLGAEKMYELDSGKKTYTVMTFAEMKQRLESAVAVAKSSTKEKGKEAPNLTARAEVKVTDTGNTQTIGGYECKQYLMQFDLKMQDQESKQEATLSTVTDAWLTRSAPGVNEMNAFYRKMAEKLGTTELGRQLMAGGDRQSSDFSAGMRRMASEMKKMDGYAMRTVFYFGSAEAAKAEALKAAMQPASEEEGGEKKKGGLGGLLGKLGRGGQDQEGQQQGGGVVMKMTLETKRMDTNPVDPSLFSIPEGYKQVPLDQK